MARLPETITVEVAGIEAVADALALADELARAARAVVRSWNDKRGFELGERIEELRLVLEKGEAQP